MSKTGIIVFIFFTLTGCLNSGKYKKTIAEHRNTYRQSFLVNSRSPLTESDTAFLIFFKPDRQWKKKADFVLETQKKLIEIPTYSGILKPYMIYGYCIFSHNGKHVKMEVYKSAQMPENPMYKNHLFLPFKDETNSVSTYGGGRYMDLSVLDIKDNKSIVLDFNKCYNPWCAYSDGYNCPIPPKANHLPFEVTAGEKMFTGVYKQK